MRAKEISVGCFTVGRCRGNCQHSKNITVTSVCCPHVTANMDRKQLCCIPPSILLLNVHANARSTRYANGVLLEGQAELGKNSEGQRLRARLSAGQQRRNECANKKGGCRCGAIRSLSGLHLQQISPSTFSILPSQPLWILLPPHRYW